MAKKKNIEETSNTTSSITKVDLNTTKDIKGSIISFITHPLFISFIVILVSAAVIFYMVFANQAPVLPQKNHVEKVFGQLNNPKVTVTSYEDFLCPGCKAYNSTSDALETKYADKSVQFVFKHFLIHGAEARTAAEAGDFVYVSDKTKFNTFKQKLFDEQSVNTFSIDNLVKWGQELGMNADNMRSDLVGRSYKDSVQKDFDDGKNVGVHATPSIYVNGTLVNGTIDPQTGTESIPTAEQVSAAIDAQLTK